MRKTRFSGKKAGILFLAFALFLGFAFSQGEVQEQVRKYVVVIKGANVRTMPSIQGSIITTVRSGEKLELVEDLGTWVKVRLPQGKIGYIWSKLVRIEVEKIVKPVSQSKPTSQLMPKTQSPKPQNYPTQEKTSLKFSISLNLNYNLVNPKDLNLIAKGENEYFESYLVPIWQSRGFSTEIDHPLEELKRLFGGCLEGKFFLTENIALGMGFSILSGSKNSTTTLNFASGGHSYTDSADLTFKTSILAPYIGVAFAVPTDPLNFELFGDIGYFMGSFSVDFTQSYDLSKFRYHITDMKKNAIGFTGGVRLNFNLTPQMGIFISGKYRLLKFKDLTGTLTDEHAGTTIEGNVYAYEEKLSNGEWVPFLWVFETEPADPNLRSVKKAEFNFSGFSLGIGFFYRF